ncbi:GAF and ANTAR domain-containing protein [Clavibacter sepedonicus]|uniref:Regulatory protein n=1 Tax=Clavibacter sepedonicus TaxID=31964 RepID=B0RCJ0_CLASE|nr:MULTISPECIES: GAF and ANTAR domain-containing protein [Clavibacter]MBD5381068.1 GAF and ANTAR domain-containing protein [Clavibacter sp.]OQJ48997.1 ANTAR domain-containing protein [Clavibacter sepedonicus]OQJ53693.1 ANTAR domain-containing protein [Clavibacter sepedonicus]UUK65181.1 GAF and ANTAR domain-containing protein [Clavibacter sepedonicus]CAQ00589.1 putative regulatory protein [Clavibacter sepedonicus]
MPRRAAVADAAEALERAGNRGSDLSGPLASVFGVSGAAVSTLGDPLGSETVSASDERAARLDEIQLDLGEGPCWEAMTSRVPVLEPDMRTSAGTSWPLARHAMHEAGLGAVFAFPLELAGLSLGAVDLYSRTARDISDREVTDATALSRIVARQVLRRALLTSEAWREETDAWKGRYSRREVHQATGMVVAQMGISPTDALLVLRGHAFATGRPVRDVAEDVVGRILDFTPER